MKHLQNCIHFLHEGQEILSSKDGIKLHSLLHHQFSAPVFGDILCYAMLCYAMLCYAMLCNAMQCYAMPCYAWCTSKLTNNRSFLELYWCMFSSFYGCLLSVSRGTRWRFWLWHCATNWGGRGFDSLWLNLSGRTLSVGSIQSVTAMGTKGYFVGVKAAGA
jgi:hypothetical protein